MEPEGLLRELERLGFRGVQAAVLKTGRGLVLLLDEKAVARLRESRLVPGKVWRVYSFREVREGKLTELEYHVYLGSVVEASNTDAKQAALEALRVGRERYASFMRNVFEESLPALDAGIEAGIIEALTRVAEAYTAVTGDYSLLHRLRIRLSGVERSRRRHSGEALPA